MQCSSCVSSTPQIGYRLGGPRTPRDERCRCCIHEAHNSRKEEVSLSLRQKGVGGFRFQTFLFESWLAGWLAGWRLWLLVALRRRCVNSPRTSCGDKVSRLVGKGASVIKSATTIGDKMALWHVFFDCNWDDTNFCNIEYQGILNQKLGKNTCLFCQWTQEFRYYGN